MKKNNLTIVMIFLLVLGTFSISGVLDNPEESSPVSDNKDIPSLRSSFDTTFFDLEGRNLIYPYQNNNLEGAFFTGKNFDKFNYSGYIIEFEKPSIIERKVELEKIAERNKDFFLANIPIISDFFVTFDNLDSRVQRYENNIDTENEKIKNEILTKTSLITGNAVSDLNQERIVLNEYNLVFNGIALNISDREAKEIENIKGVRKAWPNYKVEALLMDSVPLIQEGIPAGRMGKNGETCADSSYCHAYDQSYSSGGAECNADPLCRWSDYDSWCEPREANSCLTGEGIKIAIIDTGIDYTHQDLGGCIGINCKVIGGYDVINNDEDPMDDHGHGTHVAATAAGNGVLKGVAPDAKILAYKVLDAGGSGSYESVIEGIEKAVGDDADIISMSLGGYGNPDDPVSTAVDNAVDAGVVSVIAAGNSGSGENTIGSPGTARKAITVGATDKFDNLAGFSSRGPVIWEDENENEKSIVKPDVVAPGVDICAAQASNNWLSERECLDSTHITISGTSMATPHVAGTVALLKQKNPDWTPKEIKAVLKGTVVNLGLSPVEQGAGRVNILGTVSLASEPLTPFIEVSGEIFGTIDITGNIGGSNLKNYEVSYGVGINPITWTQVYVATTTPSNGVLVPSFNTRLLPEGQTATIRLRATNLDNRVFEDRTLVTARNVFLDLKDYEEFYPSVSEEIEIKGTVSGDDLQSFVLQYGAGQSPSSWVDITSSNTMRQGVLGRLNISALDGYFTIRLRATFNTETVEISRKIFIDSLLKENWPVRFNGNIFSSPVTRDLDGNGRKEIAIGWNVFNSGGYGPSGLYVFDDRANLKFYKTNGELPQSSAPAIGDINNDGENEIVFATYGWLRVYSKSGTQLWQSRIWNAPSGSGASDGPTPTLADIDSDPELEIIVGSIDPKMYAFNHDGTTVTGWPITIGSGWVRGQSVADLDDDGDKEIVFVSDGSLYVVGEDGNGVAGYPKSISANSLPSIGDIDDDGDLEIAVATSDDKVYILHHDGTTVTGWPRQTIAYSFYPPALGDVDGDGKLEIFYSNRWNAIYGWRFDGIPLSGWGPKYTETGERESGITLADVNGDSKADVLAKISLNTGVRPSIGGPPLHNFLVYAWNVNGSLIANFPRQLLASSQWYLWGDLAVDDIDDNGKVELIAGSMMDIENLGVLKVWELGDDTGPSAMPWPTYMHDSQHTSCYDCDKRTSPQTQIPLSKIENLGDTSANINLSVKIQQFDESDNWVDYIEAINESYSIPSKEKLNLAELFNGKNITINTAGRYRINVTATDSSGKIIASSIENFVVLS